MRRKWREGSRLISWWSARGGRRHRFREGRPGVPVCGAAVLGTLGKSTTARSQSACTPPPTPRPRRWTGGCSARELGRRPGRAPGSPRITRRRRAGGFPPMRHHRREWRLALDMIDESARGWGRPCPGGARPWCADAGYGDTTAFRELGSRGGTYVVAVKAATSAPPATPAPDTAPPRQDGPPAHPATRTAAANSPWRRRTRARPVTWRRGHQNHTRRSRRDDALAVSSRCGYGPPTATSPAPTTEAPGAGCWPNGPPAQKNPPTTGSPPCPTTPPSQTLVRLAKIRWRIEHDYRELKTGLGLDHFEGRSWLGWHHHVTLVAVAHLFCTLRTTDPKAPAPG